MVAQSALSAYDHVIVLSGDAPQINPQTIAQLLNFHLDQKAAMTLLSADLDHPTGYGRVIRRNPRSSEVQAIVEEKSSSPAQKKIREVNAGFYVFDVPQLFAHINETFHCEPSRRVLPHRYGQPPAPGPAAASSSGKTQNSAEVLGATRASNSRSSTNQMRMRKCHELMTEGVTIFYPASCVIDNDVEIAPDTVLEPFVQILGRSRIGAGCRIRSYSVIRDSEVADGVLLRPGCILEGARVERNAVLGPYSHLRPGSDIGRRRHVGNFVETKKIKLGKGSKANHLTYLGDAEIGAGVQHRRRNHHLQLRWRSQAHTVIEDEVFHRQRQHPGRPPCA